MLTPIKSELQPISLSTQPDLTWPVFHRLWYRQRNQLNPPRSICENYFTQLYPKSASNNTGQGGRRLPEKKLQQAPNHKNTRGDKGEEFSHCLQNTSLIFYLLWKCLLKILSDTWGRSMIESPDRPRFLIGNCSSLQFYNHDQSFEQKSLRLHCLVPQIILHICLLVWLPDRLCVRLQCFGSPVCGAKHTTSHTSSIGAFGQVVIYDGSC